MKAIELYKRENQVVLITAVDFKTLRNIVKFTERIEPSWSPKDDQDEPNEEQYYQRPTNENRVQGIKKYISKTLFDDESKDDVLFPSSLILGVETDLEKLEYKNDIVDFSFPIEEKSCLIVDGQHRMKAMISLFDDISNSANVNELRLEKLNAYKFNCTILLNYDLWEQASIFASVNFNQKPVDRSLYFDIFGEAPRDQKDKERSNLYIAHELGKYLNSSPKSPLQGFVKNFRKKEGFVSQAFLMHSLLSHFGPRGTWSEITEDYAADGQLYKKLPKIYISYFNAIKNVLRDYWPKTVDKDEATFLTKTTGLGALIRLLGHINKMMNLDLFPGYDDTNLIELDISRLEDIFLDIFSVLNDKPSGSKETYAELLFGKNSKYHGSGSIGLQSQLFKELADIIGIPVN